MRRWLNDLDRILRGDATRLSALREETIEVPLGGLSLVILALALCYGACMGVFAGFRVDGPSYTQWLASTLKVPALFFLTLGVTFPSLYVFNALVGSRLNLVVVLQLLVAALAVNLAVLASLGPIVAFFSVSTTSHSFMVLLNVLAFAVSGALGLAFLLQTLHRLSVARQGMSPQPPCGEVKPAEQRLQQDQHDQEGRPAQDANETAPPERPGAEEPSALDKLQGHVLGRHVKTVFVCWMVIFGLVGAQMGWVLRPFVGDPSLPFRWFRPRGSNFFEGVWEAFRSLF